MNEGEPAEDGIAEARRSHAHIGEVLRGARLDEGRELSDIAALTRVPLRHLTAIEEGDHSRLPALPYSLGFVRSYARAVGVDAEDAAYRFRQETTISTPEPSAAMVTPIDGRRAPPKSAILIGLGLFALVALGIVLWSVGLFDGNEEPAEFDPLTADTEVASEIGTAPPEVTAQAETEVPAASETATNLSGPIVIRADEPAWTRIRGGGEVLLMRVMEAGETFAVPENRSDLEMRTGNAGALTITVGGQTLPKLGAEGDVIGDVQLTPAGLQAAVGSREQGGGDDGDE